MVRIRRRIQNFLDTSRLNKSLHGRTCKRWSAGYGLLWRSGGVLGCSRTRQFVPIVERSTSHSQFLFLAPELLSALGKTVSNALDNPIRAPCIPIVVLSVFHKSR